MSFYNYKRSISESDTDDPSPKRSNFSDKTDESEEIGFEAAKPASLNEPGQFSSVIKNIMSKMGHEAGKGLGRAGQGRLEPVAMSNQRGRRGLGLIIQGLEKATNKWDPTKERIEIKETVSWLSCPTSDPPPIDEDTWVVIGDRKTTIDDETDFCDPSILHGIIQCKSVFDSLEPEELRKARTRSNPFETIRGAIFLNRAAVKMANMDSIFDFMFTHPKTPNGKPVLTTNDLLYFADVCAGPGGFSEYVLWRKQWRAKGFGFTLKDSNDFKLEDFLAGSPETFERHYGVDGDGNVFKEGNIREFSQFVKDSTYGRGVHFMMADGGFSVEGQENIQEILSKQLYLCQFLVAMNIVADGGNFVCKLFDIFTHFSVGLIYLMYRSFGRITIHKPNTSRPANSERYIICQWKHPNTDGVRDFLFHVNKLLNGFSQNEATTPASDVNEIVPRSLIMEDEAFVDFIRSSNDSLGEAQIVGLAKISAFAEDPSLDEKRQRQIRKECLEYWQVPDEVRRSKHAEHPKEMIKRVFEDYPEFFFSEMKPLRPPLANSIRSIYDWKCVVVGESSERTFFISKGRSHVYKLVMKTRDWQKVDSDTLNVELPEGTLIYAEILREYRGQEKSQRKSNAFHIIDAIFLGKDDLRQVSFKERNLLIHVFVEAMNKRTQPERTVMRCKTMFGLEALQKQLKHLSLRHVKGGGPFPRLAVSVSDNSVDPFFIPTGVLCFRLVSNDYIIAFSKTHQRKYWFNIRNRVSAYDCPRESCLDFSQSFESRLFWDWREGVKILDNQPIKVTAADDKIHSSTLLHYIQENL